MGHGSPIRLMSDNKSAASNERLLPPNVSLGNHCSLVAYISGEGGREGESVVIFHSIHWYINIYDVSPFQHY